MLWKNKTCKDCLFKDEAPRPPGVPNLKAEKMFLCKESPPHFVYAIGGRPDRPNNPVPVPLGSMYPPVDDYFPACARYKTLEV